MLVLAIALLFAGTAAGFAEAAGSFRFPGTAAPAPAAGPAAPIRLTASDGTGLTLVALEADGVLEPPLAFTELRLTFDNPRDEVIEGRFQIDLPPGAAISRFAMEIDGRWQEGEVVERRRARGAYEDFLHRRQDPALLEQEAANRFSARVFPIPARGRKELIVSYSQPLARSDRPFVLPLLGLSEIGALDIRVLLGERTGNGGEGDRRAVELHRRAWTPEHDFEVGQELLPERSGLRHGDLAVVRVTVPVDPVPQEVDGLYVLVDSSASRALGYRAQVHRLGELIGGLRDGAGRRTPVGVAAFDQEVTRIYEGPAGGFGLSQLQPLAERRPLGASDLHRALVWLADRLAVTGERHPRVLLITDGVATAGETEAGTLRTAVIALGDHGVERLDILAVGGLRDEAVLRALTTGNLEHDGQSIEGDASLAEITRRLTLACRSGIEVAIEGADWVWPETLDGFQPGDQALIYAELPLDRPLRPTLAGVPQRLGEIATVARPLLERASVQARIERLLYLRETAFAGDADRRLASLNEVVELSVRHRVLSPFTALLVLETEDDYRRYDLDRTALADILTVGDGGLEVATRSPLAPPPPPSFAETLTVRGSDLDQVAIVGVEDAPPPPPSSPAETEPPETGEPAEPIRVAAEPAPEPPRPQGAVPQPDDAVAESDFAEEIVVTGEALPVEVTSATTAAIVDGEMYAEPHDGRYAEVTAELAAGRLEPARALAERWNDEAPGDLLALLALGEVWESAGETGAAARAYGSLIDLFPGRADLRRVASQRLARLGEDGLGLAIDSYRKAAADRPDHPSGHRLLAWALWHAGRFEEAFAALETALGLDFPEERFPEVERILREDLGLLAAAWLAAEPERLWEVLGRLDDHGARLPTEPSLRFVLSWETDANDVDLHVHDRWGGHAYYEEPQLASGGELYDDVTDGYGPECFAIAAPEGRLAAPYRLAVHYFDRGPMGYGLGVVQVVEHDGRGGLDVESRPFVVMADDALLELGEVPEAGQRRAAGP